MSKEQMEKEIAALKAKVAEQGMVITALRGTKFSDRHYIALKSRAELAEAKVAELEKKLALSNAKGMSQVRRLATQLDAKGDSDE